ncbi:MAG: hypothetical protein ACYTFA_17985, partial [Planctomycetota bacterium]
MCLDPYIEQIVKKLGTQLNPKVFERCVVDLLLQVDHLAVVPIGGSADAGMDGAIADGEGPPFPLVSTTGTDVIGNLRRNLKSYLKHGGTREKAVLATSQALTPLRRRNLENAAAEHGFVLVQIYDQAALAERLYRQPRWCRDLLRLTGEAPALSSIPLIARPFVGDQLVGRDEDLAWLTETDGDAVICGQPG